MKTMNASLRTGGNQATETNSAAALTQFEGTSVAGAGTVPSLPSDAATAQVPPAGGGGGGSSGSTSDNSGAQNVDTCTDQQYWNGVSCINIYTPSSPGNNATPWQDKVNQATDLIFAAAILGLLAGILYSFKDAKPYGAIFEILAYICLIATICCAIAAIVLGTQINNMGGSPQGTLDIVAGGATIIAALLAMYSKQYDTYGYIVLAAIGIYELIELVLGK
jgi:hypothetical protein